MLRTTKTIGYIIGYAALVSSQLNKVKHKKTLINDVRKQDEMIFLYAKRWASRILDSAGVTTHLSGNTEPFDEPVLDPIEPSIFEDKTMQEVSQFVQGKISNTVQSLKENHYVKN
ncbi:hypothetical protein [Mammaliicoccus sciuri]|uniref:hypothetical protein n=1 Tax=Mammaliicoccus sciuri TaxID=1296 RepID=UPI00227079B4|nr:hypothetical protein [Mammaliicoccus sciuri]MCY1028483.1 hypothetical protein [Mammaliicoccus sciuri]